MLADEIANYANDYSSSGRFAIVLYGEWGSGKTYFCENVLASRLKKDGLTLLRVSLFGVNGIDDLCERILATLCHLPKCLFREGSSSIVSEVNSLLGKVGLRVDIKAQTVLSMLDPWIRKKSFLVLDDVERSGFPDAEGNGGLSCDLLGVVNDMVENHGWHVMLIRNKPYEFNHGSSEKVIIRQFRYHATPTDVYEAAAASLAQEVAVDFDVRQATVRGIASSEKVNVRAFARILPMLKMVLSSQTIHSSRIDKESRSRAYTDVVESAMLAASGTPPSRPNSGNDQAFTTQYIHSFNIYHNFTDLQPVVRPLDRGDFPSSEVIEKTLSEYLAKRYPSSPEDASIIRMSDQIDSLTTMEDDQAASLSKQFNAALLRKGFSSSVLVRAWRTYAQLAELGFEEAFPREGALYCLKRVVDRNPSSAYESIHGEYELWIHATPDPMDQDDALDELFSYAKECIDCQAGERLAFLREPINPETGLQLSRWFADEGKEAFPIIHKVPVGYVVACLTSGNASSQMAMRDAMRKVLPNTRNRYEESGRIDLVSHWIATLQEELSRADAGSKLGNYRLKIIRSDIDMLLQSMSAGTQQ